MASDRAMSLGDQVDDERMKWLDGARDFARGSIGRACAVAMGYARARRRLMIDD